MVRISRIGVATRCRAFDDTRVGMLSIVATARNLAHADPLANLDRDHLVGIVAPVVQNFLTAL